MVYDYPSIEEGGGKILKLVIQNLNRGGGEGPFKGHKGTCQKRFSGFCPLRGLLRLLLGLLMLMMRLVLATVCCRFEC